MVTDRGEGSWCACPSGPKSLPSVGRDMIGRGIEYFLLKLEFQGRGFSCLNLYIGDLFEKPDIKRKANISHILQVRC